MQELTLDFAGITRRWLMRRRCGRTPDVLWRPTQVAFGERVTLAEMWGLEPLERMRLLRLSEAVRAYDGPKLALAIGEATSVGDVNRGLRYLDIWMGKLRMTPHHEAEMSLYLRRLQRRLRPILHEERLITAPRRSEQEATQGYLSEVAQGLEVGAGCGLLLLMDMPAWITPFAVPLFRRMIGPERLQVISGGDRLAPGIWCWDFAAENGEVILRSSPTDTVAVTAMLQRQAFEPPSGRQT